MEVSVEQDDDFLYHLIKLSRSEIIRLQLGIDIEGEYRYDLIGNKALQIKIRQKEEQILWKGN